MRTADGSTDMLQMRDFLTHCLAVDAHISDVEHKEQPVDADAVTSTETNESLRWEICAKYVVKYVLTDMKTSHIKKIALFVPDWKLCKSSQSTSCHHGILFLDAAQFTFSCLVLSFLVTAKQTLRKVCKGGYSPVILLSFPHKAEIRGSICFVFFNN